MMTRTLAAVLISLAAAAPAAAQEAPGEAGRRAEALDRLLGSGADLPRPDLAPAQTLTRPPAPLPPWIAAQPYRQQPLFATVPIGTPAVTGRVRGSGVP
jgi:hypothetical protein